MVEKKRETKSPIKDLPVRTPGQSLGEKIRETLDSKIGDALMLAAMVVVVVWMEWAHYLLKLPPAPRTLTFVGAIVLIWVVFRISKGMREIRDMKNGLVGEEAVGQFLEEKLRPLGFQVLHDIPFDGFNIDHVVIGATGVYTVETKTHSKPEKGACEVVCDGEHITVNGYKPDRDPIVQARASARSLYELLESSTGKKFIVKPVVLYPGWYVKSTPSNAEVWVLNEKALPTFIGNSKKIVPPEDVSLITFHLKRYVIASGQEKR